MSTTSRARQHLADHRHGDILPCNLSSSYKVENLVLYCYLIWHWVKNKSEEKCVENSLQNCNLGVLCRRNAPSLNGAIVLFYAVRLVIKEF
jgi:hypothetical protein